MSTTSEINAARARELLYAAAASENGLIVRVHAPNVVARTQRASQLLWNERKNVDDIDLRKLQIRLSPDDPDNEIWIIKFDKELPGHHGYDGGGEPPTQNGGPILIEDL